uniref:Uncharacterized protein n=1 Tax=Fundulus heteroclitus TaxID=8078 RepID=A0A3Q2R160_FUNHE
MSLSPAKRAADRRATRYDGGAAARAQSRAGTRRAPGLGLVMQTRYDVLEIYIYIYKKKKKNSPSMDCDKVIYRSRLSLQNPSSSPTLTASRTAVVPHQVVGLLGPRSVPSLLELLGFAPLPLAPVRVSPVGVPVASPGVPVEQAEPQQVDEEPRGAHPGHHHRMVDLVGLAEALHGLQDDGEAQRREEDGVDQSPHHLRPDPAEGVLLGRLGFLGEPKRDQSHDQRDDVRQHVEGVREHREGGGEAADHHLDDEEAESQREHT